MVLTNYDVNPENELRRLLTRRSILEERLEKLPESERPTSESAQRLRSIMYRLREINPTSEQVFNLINGAKRKY